MKFVTWNVNGLRACMGKGLLDYTSSAEADFIALQETKVNMPLPDINFPGYTADWNCGERLGYSGTVTLFKNKPLSVSHKLGADKLDARVGQNAVTKALTERKIPKLVESPPEDGSNEFPLPDCLNRARQKSKI